jgi:site-specific DNA-methyltransferase (adenine-specific)
MSNFFEAGKAAMTSERDDWETPQALFDRLDAVYHFTLDPCSTHENAKCAKHYTVVEDGLAQSWQGERVFCNPPYGRNIGTWVKKCAEESKGALVVMLIPARTDTAYFHDYIYRKAHIEFLRGRLKFERGGVGVQSAPFPSMLVIWGRND